MTIEPMPMSLPLIDLALRAAAIAILLVLAVSLLRDVRQSVAGRLGVAFALGSVAHAAASGIGAALPVSAWHALVIALSTGNVVVFWLFTCAMFDDTFRLRPWHGLVWLAVAAFSFVNCMWIAPGGHVRLSIVAVNLLALGFIGLAMAQMIASWSADLVEGRRRLRVFIVSAAALYGGVTAVTQIWAPQGDAAAVATSANAAMFTLVVAAIAVAMMQVAPADLFPAPSAATSTPTVAQDAADQKLVDALMRLIADDRIYRHDNVTIGTLATRLAIPEYRLRRLINQRLGYRNFNVFVNEHRIAEAKAALADPTQAEVPVITIAMDAGFQSLGPFNRAFKADTGVTPTEYRRLKASAA
jgi:AraC-like DNA-binding protein